MRVTSVICGSPPTVTAEPQEWSSQPEPTSFLQPIRRRTATRQRRDSPTYTTAESRHTTHRAGPRKTQPNAEGSANVIPAAEVRLHLPRDRSSGTTIHPYPSITTNNHRQSKSTIESFQCPPTASAPRNASASNPTRPHLRPCLRQRPLSTNLTHHRQACECLRHVSPNIRPSSRNAAGRAVGPS